jgi:hypothetical protein
VFSSEAAKGEEDSQRMIIEIQRLQESELIAKKMIRILAATSLIGVLSLILPYLFSIVPVYETK